MPSFSDRLAPVPFVKILYRAHVLSPVRQQCTVAVNTVEASDGSGRFLFSVQDFNRDNACDKSFEAGRYNSAPSHKQDQTFGRLGPCRLGPEFRNTHLGKTYLILLCATISDPCTASFLEEHIACLVFVYLQRAMPIRQETHEPPSIDPRLVLRPLALRNLELGRATTKSQRQMRDIAQSVKSGINQLFPSQCQKMSLFPFGIIEQI